MTTMLLAVLLASLLGSFHCACMCGPMAVWSSGVTGPGRSGTSLRPLERSKRIGGYHVGRLITYLILGVLAGVAGKAIGMVGDSAGIQSAAARVAGATMIGIGVWKLTMLWPLALGTPMPSLWASKASSRIAKAIASARPPLSKLPVTARSVGLGAITVLLPCGWLYLFVIFSGGSGSILSSLGIMLAFWLGTVPSLVVLVTGWLHLQSASRQRLPRFMPAIGALTLILLGAHTATGRASADLRQLERRLTSIISDPSAERSAVLSAMKEQPLPCCQHEK